MCLFVTLACSSSCLGFHLIVTFIGFQSFGKSCLDFWGANCRVWVRTLQFAPPHFCPNQGVGRKQGVHPPFERRRGGTAHRLLATALKHLPARYTPARALLRAPAVPRSRPGRRFGVRVIPPPPPQGSAPGRRYASLGAGAEGKWLSRVPSLCECFSVRSPPGLVAMTNSPWLLLSES